MNLRPSGYEPDELPGCSIPRCFFLRFLIVREIRFSISFLTRFGGDLLSHVLRRSTIGATALNGRVRNGSGCFARAMTTKPRKERDTVYLLVECCPSRVRLFWCVCFCSVTQDCLSLVITGSNQAYRAISTSQLNALLRLHLWPIDVVVYHGPQGYLVLRGASRLDAFSGYPVRS